MALIWSDAMGIRIRRSSVIMPKLSLFYPQPCSPALLAIDTPGFRYLNHSHSPIPHQLKSTFNIQMYNNLWFSADPATHPPLFEFTDSIESSPGLATLRPPFPTPSASLPVAAAIPILPNDDPFVPATPGTGPSLLAAVTSSTDRLFFVSYCCVKTLPPCWYLVRVDLPMCIADSACANFATSGHYYCHFYARHPYNAYKPLVAPLAPLHARRRLLEVPVSSSSFPQNRDWIESRK
jgi:hypothetical protein